MNLKPSKLKQGFKPCMDMARRDLCRFWLLPAAALLAFVLFAVIPDLKPVQIMTRNNPLQDKPVILLVAAILPVLASLSVFTWLHNQRMSARIHALPLTRNQHFFSHVFSGWVLSILPFVILFLAYMYMMGHSDMQMLLVTETDYYGNAYFWTWLADMLITVTYVYNLSVLAGILAGTVLTHLLLAMLLNGLLPVAVYLINRMVIEFWTGFYSLPLASSQLSPLTREWRFTYFRYLDSTAAYLIYTAVALAALLMAWLLYRRLKLEREGGSAAFKGFGEFVCVCFGFVGLCSGGMLLYSVSDSRDKALFLMGAAIGGLIFYIAARMILEKRLQIFSPANLKKLCAFVLCGAAFAVFMVFDLGGYAKRLPEVSDTTAVKVHGHFEPDDDMLLNDPAMLEKSRELGLALAEHGKPGEDAGKYDGKIFFTYYLDEGDARIVHRFYSFDPVQPDIAGAYAALFDDPAYKKLSLLYGLTADEISEMLLCPDSINDRHDMMYIIDPSHFNALAEAIREDFRSMTYADLIKAREQNKTPICGLNLMIKDASGNGSSSNYNLDLRQDYSRTLQVLKKYGYDKYIPKL